MSSDHLRRVLIVDDDADVRSLLVVALSQKALATDCASNGREAIERLRERDYAVILLDLMMPGVDGFGVLEAIRNEIPNPPVVLVITGASREMLERVDRNRIHGIVRKPFDPLEVAAIVAACADVRGSRSFDTMTLATMVSGGALIGWLRGL